MEYFEDVEIGISQPFGRYPVRREEIIAFAEKYDPQPFHLSDEGAAQVHFGKLCASGWHSCAMTMRMLIDELSQHNPQATLGSPGVDNLRWHKPVFAGDVLHCEMTITDKRRSKSRPGIGSLYTTITTFNQNDEKVLSMDAISLIACREKS